MSGGASRAITRRAWQARLGPWSRVERVGAQYSEGDDPLRHEQDRASSRSRALRDGIGRHGVTVNALLPGPTHTENTDKLRAERARTQGITVEEIEAAFFRDFRPTSLLRRFTSADEVAHWVSISAARRRPAPLARPCGSTVAWSTDH